VFKGIKIRAGRWFTPPTLALLAGAKLLRAHDGCLGARKRRRTWLVCDKPRGADKWALIRGCPNRETGQKIFCHPALNS